jgi:hypothetical protein
MKQVQEYKPVEFNDDINLSDNYYVNREGDQWLTSSLIQQVKEQELIPFKLPLQCINTGMDMWDSSTIYKIAYHVRRAYLSDYKYPVILDETGFIMDGWHRVLRALIEDKEYVMAVRFKKTPPPDIRHEDDGK